MYGLQLTAPLRALLSLGDKDKGAGKEEAGTIERYRAEFGLLCDALDGRLVIFIDDLDRCSPATVNSLLEMTNYLVDVGRCFVVMGAAVERVKLCILSPVDGKYNETYANEYLRKLIHIELPVPLRRAALEELLRDRKQDPPPSNATRWPGTVLRWLLIFALVGALASIFYLGGWLHASGDGKAQQVLSRPMATERGASASAPAPDGPPRADSALRPKPETSVQDVGISATADAPGPGSP